MKKLLIFLALLIAHPASAAFFLRTDCGTVVGPVEADVCAQSTTVSGRTAGHLYIYRSSAWVDVDSAGAGSPPTDATYITQTPNAGLDSEQALSTLATGVLKNTTTTGVLSIATPGTDYVAPTGSGAGLTALNASQLGSGTAPTARLGSGTANSSTFLRGDSTWASPTVSSLSADGANCAAGQAPLGVDAAGASQGCFDVATQVELNTHSGLTGTGAHGATTTNTASQIVARDGSGNFAAGTITATLTGNVTGNVTGNADTATLAATATTVVNDAIGPTQLDETANYTWTGTHTFTGATVALNHDQLSELDDDDHSAIYVKYESTAGAPAANSCERDGQIQFDTTNNKIYMCPSTGATPIDVGTQSDAYSQFSDGTLSATSSGADTMTISGSDIVEAHVFAITSAFTNQPAGDGIEVISSDINDTSALKVWGYRSGKSIGALTYESITLNGTTQVSSIYTDWESIMAVQYPSTPVGTITIREASGNATITTLNGSARAADRDIIIVDAQPITKSVYFPAHALTTDGTQCANPALATINSGIRTYTILCADNDASTIWGSAVMPDSWNGGTVTFELVYVQTAADTAVMNSDISAQCRPAGGTINSTFGTEVAIDDAAVSGSSVVDMTTSAAVTPNGTCAGGDMLNFKWQLDATGTTTAVATLHILGIKMEYAVGRGGNDN